MRPFYLHFSKNIPLVQTESIVEFENNKLDLSTAQAQCFCASIPEQIVYLHSCSV